MTLGARLLLAILAVTVMSTVALGLGVREAWSRAEEERFNEQFLSAFERLRHELDAELKGLPGLVQPLCQHDPLVDSALVGLKSGDLDERRLSVSLRVRALAEALKLDELVLLTSRAEVLGAAGEGLVGRRDRALADKALALAAHARLRSDAGPLAVETGCVRKDPTNPKIWVALYAARHVERLLSEVGASYDVVLSRDPKPIASDSLQQTMHLSEFGNLSIVAARSRARLSSALRRLDLTVLGLGLGTLALALLLGGILSRGITRPIVEMSRQVQQVGSGEAKPVAARGGGRELEDFATAFNQAITDLALLRKRLAATERIAAQREIARRVAHEIKNPLAPIRAAVETLRRLHARNDPAFEQYFDEATRTVLDEVARISTIVTEFTRFARLPPPSPEALDVVETVRRVVQLHATGRAAIHFDAERCPAVNADKNQLIQVMTNLLQNALEATQTAENPTVWVSVSPAGDSVEIRVGDNGSGIAPELRERLFEPYVTTKTQGTGLGLSIVERIVVEHGGEIHVEEHTSGGAWFVVRWPLAGPAWAEAAPASGSLARPAAGSGGEREA